MLSLDLAKLLFYKLLAYYNCIYFHSYLISFGLDNGEILFYKWRCTQLKSTTSWMLCYNLNKRYVMCKLTLSAQGSTLGDRI